MGGSKEKCKDIDENVECQLCDNKGHKTLKCPWLYYKCKEIHCGGIMLLSMDEEEEAYGKKILKCQYSIYKGFIILEEATQSNNSSPISSSSKMPSSSAYTSPSQLGCFECMLFGHWAQNCPWKKTKCPRGRSGHMKLWTSSKESNKGKKFVKCLNCGKFEWLSTLVARLNMDDLCKDFDKTM